MADLTEARLRAFQRTANEVLQRCERVIVPLAEAGPERRSVVACYFCRRVPDAILSLREDGTEMFWAAVCADHHDMPCGLTVSIA